MGNVLRSVDQVKCLLSSVARNLGHDVVSDGTP